MASDSTKWVPLTCHGHSRPVTHLEFSSLLPSDPSYYLVSGCKDNQPMLRNGQTGDWIGTFIGHKGAVWQSRLSSDASLAATAAGDFSAKVWDTMTGEAITTIQHNHIVRAVAFPGQERPQILATGGREKQLRIFDLSRCDTNTTVSAGDAGDAPRPDYEIGQGVHKDTIKSIVWAQDRNIIITAADDQKLRWWDLRDKNVIGEYTVEGTIGTFELNTELPGATATNGANGGSSASLGTPGAGTLCLAAGKSAYFFDGAKPATLLKQVTTPNDIASVAIHSGHKRFVTGGASDTYMRVWDYETEQELEVGKGHHGPIWSVAYAPDGKLFATGSEDGTVKLWNNSGGAYGLWKDR